MTDPSPSIGQERLLALRAAHASPTRIALERIVVDSIDQHLCGYGIAETVCLADLDERASAALSRDDTRRFRNLWGRRNKAHQQSRGVAECNAAFYDGICSDPLLGIVHSAKRPYILDSLAALHWVCGNLEIEGSVLDVGCHGGYHTSWIGQRSGITAMGVDASEQAISYANRRHHAAGTTYICGDVRNWRPAETFEVVFMDDGPFGLDRDVDRSLKMLIDENLRLGGVVVSIGDEAATSVTEIKDTATAYGLSLGLSDVVGGWFGDRYEGSPVLVFVKDGRGDVPGEMLTEFDSVWNQSFPAYANSPSTSPREKTQAFHRAAMLQQRPH